MENSDKPPKQQQKRNRSTAKPPGQFVTNDLEENTARFIEEVKDLAQRRKQVAAEKRGGPPRPDGDQRSRRR